MHVFIMTILSNLNKNLAIANRSRVSCARNNVEGINSNPVTLKSRLRVTQDREIFLLLWKANRNSYAKFSDTEPLDKSYTRKRLKLTISRVIQR